MTRKSRGISGIESAIILIAIVLVAAFLANSIVNIGSTSVGKVKESIGTGLTQSSSSLLPSGAILGLMCLDGESGCGKHSSLGMVSYPVRLGSGGTPVDLDFSQTVIKYLSNSVEFDDIYNGTVDLETPIVYIMDTLNHRAQIIDADGNFVREFGNGPAGGPGQFSLPRGIDITKSGVIYTADTGNSRIQVFDSAGGNSFSFGAFGAGENQFNQPWGVAYDTATGNVVVADTFNNRIQVYDSSGIFRFMMGWGVDTGAAAYEICTGGCQVGIGFGAGDGQFSFPLRVSTDGSRIYVADFFNNRVQVLDFDGAFLFAFDGSVGPGPGPLGLPAGIEAAHDKIYVSEFGANRVQVFDSLGNFLFTFGSAGGGAGQFSNPFEIDVDGSGNIYVIDDGVNNRVQIFNPSGVFLSTFGSTGAGPGQFNGPGGIAIASFNGDPTTSVGVAAGRGIITSSIDSTYGPSASNTAAWIFFPVSKSETNSVLEKGEHAVIAVAYAPEDRPITLDKIRIELLTASGGTYTVTVNVPASINSITELG